MVQFYSIWGISKVEDIFKTTVAKL